MRNTIRIGIFKNHTDNDGRGEQLLRKPFRNNNPLTQALNGVKKPLKYSIRGGEYNFL